MDTRFESAGGSSTPPTPSYGLITATKDGSTGQTYTLNAAWTGIQWYRMTLASPYALTAIAGATSLTYVAQVADQGHRLVAVGMDGATQKAAKSYHVVYEPPVVLEANNSTTGWTTSGGAVLDTDDGKLRMTGTGTISAQATKANIGSFDPSTMGTIACEVDAGMDEGRQTMLNHRLVLRRNGVDQYLANITTTDLMYETPTPHLIGKLMASYHVSEVPGLATPGVSAMGLYLRHAGNAPYVATGKYGPILGKAGGRPTVVIGFDDNEATQGNNAFPIMQTHEFPGIFYLPKTLVNGTAGRNSIAKLQEMYAAGWDCGLDSTHNDDISSSFGTMAAWEASFLQNREYALAQGMTRGNEHICYTHGQIEVFPNPGSMPSSRIVASSVVSDGSDVVTVGGTVTRYPSGTPFTLGMRMVGHNSTDRAIVITKVIDATHVRVSQNIPAQTKPMWFLDTSHDFFTMKFPKRVKELGIRTARTTRNQGGFLTRFGFGDRGMFSFGNALHNFTFDAFKTAIDLAILRGLTIEWYTHRVEENAFSGNTELYDFINKMNYLATKRDQGLLDVMTWSQIWARDGNAQMPL